MHAMPWRVLLWSKKGSTFALSYVSFILLVPFCSVLSFTITPESVQKKNHSSVNFVLYKKFVMTN